MRHQLAAISTMAAHKEYEKLEIFVEQYRKSVPTDKDMVLCENYAANSIISHYIALAHEEGISDIDACCVLAKNSGIDDTDLCALLGNLLENAIEGCKTLPAVAEKYDGGLRCEEKDGWFLVSVQMTLKSG